MTQPFILPRSIKWVPGTSGDLVVKSELFLWSGSLLRGSWALSIKRDHKVFIYTFFLYSFSFANNGDSQNSRERKGTSLITVPFSPTHKHSDIYLQLCIWDFYLVFVMAVHVITRLLLLELVFNWMLNAFFFSLLCETVLICHRQNVVIISHRLSPCIANIATNPVS